MKKLFFYIPILIIFAFLITGCGNEEIPTLDEMKQYIEERYGKGNVIVETSEIKNSGSEYSDKGFIYKINSPLGFDYTIEAGIYYYSAPGGIGTGWRRYYINTFYEEFFKNYKEELDELLVRDGKVTSHYDFEEFYSSEKKLIFYFNINDIDDVYLLNKLLYDIRYTLKNEYNLIYMGDITIVLNDSMRSVSFDTIDTMDMNLHKEYLTRYFLNTAKLENNGSNYNPNHIYDLFINGVKYTTSINEADVYDITKYNPYFVYDPYYNEYLTPIEDVGYDYMFRDIIVNYLNGVYETGEKKYITTYKIGKAKFKTSFKKDFFDNLKSYYFKKNGIKLNIELVNPPLYYVNNHASWDYWLKLSDWATILNCNYEIKDGALYLTSK